MLRQCYAGAFKLIQLLVEFKFFLAYRILKPIDQPVGLAAIILKPELQPTGKNIVFNIAGITGELRFFIGDDIVIQNHF